MRAFRQAKRMAFSMNARYVQGLESLSGMTISFARKHENIDPHAIRRGTRPARETGMNERHGEPWARRTEPSGRMRERAQVAGTAVNRRSARERAAGATAARTVCLLARRRLGMSQRGTSCLSGRETVRRSTTATVQGISPINENVSILVIRQNTSQRLSRINFLTIRFFACCAAAPQGFERERSHAVLSVISMARALHSILPARP